MFDIGNQHALAQNPVSIFPYRLSRARVHYPGIAIPALPFSTHQRGLTLTGIPIYSRKDANSLGLH